MSVPRQNRVCFLLGIHRRSGTNFLYRLLTDHPDCHGGPIGEDYLVHHLESLKQYVDSVRGSWNPEWRAHTASDEGDRFDRCMGDAMGHFLLTLARSEAPATPDAAAGTQGDQRLLLTKTPSFGGLALFSDFFPQAPLLLLVRDGRAVVESGMRSFGWSFEGAARDWAAAARALFAKQDAEGESSHAMLVKYEDLVQDVGPTLASVFDFLGLDGDRYDQDRAAGVGVIGSSDLARSGSLHWDAVPKAEAFDPLDRFAEWSPARHQRFNWIAGREMERLGYSLVATGPLSVWERLRHRALDGWWTLGVLRRTARDVLGRVPGRLRRLMHGD
jgi:hypothetical protein